MHGNETRFPMDGWSGRQMVPQRCDTPWLWFVGVMLLLLLFSDGGRVLRRAGGRGSGNIGKRRPAVPPPSLISSLQKMQPTTYTKMKAARVCFWHCNTSTTYSGTKAGAFFSISLTARDGDGGTTSHTNQSPTHFLFLPLPPPSPSIIQTASN